MNLAHLILYVDKYHGTKTHGEDFRKVQNAEFIARVLEQWSELECYLEKFPDVAQFVHFDIPQDLKEEFSRRIGEMALKDAQTGE